MLILEVAVAVANRTRSRVPTIKVNVVLLPLDELLLRFCKAGLPSKLSRIALREVLLELGAHGEGGGAAKVGRRHHTCLLYTSDAADE